MGGCLDKPVVDKVNANGQANDLIYGISSMQGWRLTMEDTHTVRFGTKRHEDWSFFGIFDGHAGNMVSDYASIHLFDRIMRIMSTEEIENEDIPKSIREGFFKLDEELDKLMPDDRLIGSTAICTLITSNKIYYINCGDSRAVISRYGDCIFETLDHKPTLTAECQRIVNAGGSVFINRVNGILAMSRALGDFAFKMNTDLTQREQIISPEPEITIHQRNPDDEFLVLACDGIWDAMSGSEVCQFIHSRLLLTSDIEAIGNLLCDTCMFKGSRDNMTVMIVLFPMAPYPCPFAIKRESRLDKFLEDMIKDELLHGGIDDFKGLLSFVHSKVDTIENLPPGAGIYAKYELMLRAFKEIYPDNPCEIDLALY